MSETIEFNSWINQIIDALELHTETKPTENSRREIIKAYKSLYLLKYYFESKSELTEQIMQGNTNFTFGVD